MMFLLGILGWLAIGWALVVIGLLSRRLGRVTHAKPYYWGAFVAAFLVWLGALVRVFSFAQPDFTLAATNLWHVLLVDGLPALGMTLGLLVTWYYWSWLLAERD